MKTSSLLFLFLGLVSHAYAETCPPAENIFPCTCEEEDSSDIYVDCGQEVQNIEKLQVALKGLTGKRDIDLMLSDMELGKVPSNFFSGLGIKKLELSHCELDVLNDQNGPPLQGLEDSLEELVILSSFGEESVPAKLNLGHLKRLKDLDLSFNIITELGDDWFQVAPPSLEYITLSNNGIEKIGRNAFANLNNLRQLSLDGNRFGPIARSMFPSNAGKLETLELDNNALTDLPTDIFTNMPALKSASLNNNGIVRLEESTWLPVWSQLEVISIRENPIECTSDLKWASSRRRAAAIYGKCSYPKEHDGKDLEEFIDNQS